MVGRILPGVGVLANLTANPCYSGPRVLRHGIPSSNAETHPGVRQLGPRGTLYNELGWTSPIPT